MAGNVINTPVRRLKWFEEIVNVPCLGEIEHYQHSGSFKYRGPW